MGHLCTRVNAATVKTESSDRVRFATAAAVARNIGGEEAIEQLWEERAANINSLKAKGDVRGVYEELKKVIGWRKVANNIPSRLIVRQITETSGTRTAGEVTKMSGIISELRRAVRTDDLPTIDEVIRAAHAIKADKAPGVDKIPARFWRIPSLARELHSVIVRAWKEGIPDEWRASKVIGLRKKSGGFRTISLTNSAQKVYMRLLKERAEETMTNFVTDSQFGFQKGRSAIDAVNAVERRRELLARFGKEERLVLLDFSKAFDRVKPEAINLAMVEAGFSDSLRLRVLDAINGTVLLVDGFLVLPVNGTKQGCVLSPNLFTLVLALLTRSLKCQHLEYADDLVVVVSNDDESRVVIEQISKAGRQFGLELNVSKTVKIRLGKTGLAGQLKYLGVEIGDRKKALSERVSKASSAYASLYHRLFKPSVKVEMKTKMSIFQSMIESVLIYGVHVVAHSRRSLQKRLDCFVLRKLKSMFGIDATAHTSYDEMTTIACLVSPSFTCTLAQRQAVLLGHSIRHGLLPSPPPSWKAPRGRPPDDLLAVVRRNLLIADVNGVLGKLSREDVKELAEDRFSWRLLAGELAH
jgi:hypothetical protein